MDVALWCWKWEGWLGYVNGWVIEHLVEHLVTVLKMNRDTEMPRNQNIEPCTNLVGMLLPSPLHLFWLQHTLYYSQ